VADYKVEFVNSAAKEYRDLPENIRRRVDKAVDLLEQNPRPTNVRKLEGHTNLYRIRVGHYRVVYEIHEDKRVVRVTRVRHRRDAYR
jgi:mRNA interferase RelE/StbE